MLCRMSAQVLTLLGLTHHCVDNMMPETVGRLAATLRKASANLDPIQGWCQVVLCPAADLLSRC